MRRNLFSVTLIVIISISFLAGGCGKSGKEVKVGDKQNTVNNSGKPYTVNASDSKIKWTGKKVTGQHYGSIKVANGEILVDNNKITGGKVEIDMKSIVDEDQKDEESNKKLVGHLSSPDFFDVAKFPTSKIEITKVEALNDDTKPNANFSVTGNLTIKDVTKSITFPAEIKIENGVLTVKADFDIDRTDWNVKYGSGKFFENLGDKVINDKFNLNLTLVAK
jgi:polyisoprenoid-binding protein YceI